MSKDDDDSKVVPFDKYKKQVRDEFGLEAQKEFNRLVTGYLVDPVPAPRQSRRDTWSPSKSVIRYREFKDQVRDLGITIPEPYFHVIFVIEMPKSWTKKKRIQNRFMPHQSKPDIDNLGKALLDAVYPGADQHVWNCTMTKIWGECGMIVISDTTMREVYAPPIHVYEFINGGAG